MDLIELFGQLMDVLFDWMMMGGLVESLLKTTLVTIIMLVVLMGLIYSLIWVWTKLFYHPVREGRIVNKYHQSSRRWVQLIPVFTRVGKATVVNFIPIWHHDDEDWILEIEGLNDRGKLKRQYVYVSRQVWNSVEIGQYYTVSSDAELEDQNDTHHATDEEQAELGVEDAEPKE